MKKLIVAALFATALSSQAGATTLIPTNSFGFSTEAEIAAGSYSSGVLSGWTVNSVVSGKTGLGTAGSTNPNVLTGGYLDLLNATGGIGQITYDTALTAAAGTTFTVSFKWATKSGGSNTILIKLGSTLLDTLSTPTTSSGTYSSTFTLAAVSNVKFSILLGNTDSAGGSVDKRTVGIDDLGVTYTTPSPVPLPGALPLLATGLLGTGIIGWRRRKADKAV